MSGDLDKDASPLRSVIIPSPMSLCKFLSRKRGQDL